MNEALQKAQEAAAKKRAEGGLGGHVSFSAEEKQLLIEAADRTDETLVNEDGKPSTSWKVYVKTLILKAGAIDAAKPKKERKVLTLDDVNAKIAELQARAAKMAAEAAAKGPGSDTAPSA